MEMVEMAVRIEAPADAVWAIVGDFGGARLTSGFVARVELSGEGVGAVRTYHLDGPVYRGEIAELLERIDHRLREFEYLIIDNGPLPVTQYRGFTSVIPAGANACHVAIRTRFLPVGVPAADAIAMSSGVIAQFFENLRRLFETDGDME